MSAVLEIKGKSYEDTDAKHQAAKRWVAAVNEWGRLERWDFVCREPQRLAEALKKAGSCEFPLNRKQAC